MRYAGRRLILDWNGQTNRRSRKKKTQKNTDTSRVAWCGVVIPIWCTERLAVETGNISLFHLVVAGLRRKERKRLAVNELLL